MEEEHLSKCPRCGALARTPSEGEAGRCDACGAGLVVESGRLLDGGAFARTVEAADLPQVLGDALRARRAPRRVRLVEVHRTELPYWLLPRGDLAAAFASPLLCLRRIEPPAAEALPAPLASLPAVRPPAGPAPVRLVLLPAFDVRYAAHGRVFHALVDAHRGSVLADVWPRAASSPGLHAAMAGVLAVDLAAFTAAGYLAPDNLVRTVAIAALAAAIYAFNRYAVRLRDRER